MEGREEAADYYNLKINDCIFHLSSDFRFRLYHIIHKLLLNLFAIIDAIKIQ